MKLIDHRYGIYQCTAAATGPNIGRVCVGPLRNCSDLVRSSVDNHTDACRPDAAIFAAMSIIAQDTMLNI